MKTKMRAGVLSALVLLFCFDFFPSALPRLMGCKLADHSWQPVLQVDLPLPFPIILAGTLGELPTLLPKGAFPMEWHVPLTSFSLSRPWLDASLTSVSCQPEHRFQAPSRRIVDTPGQTRVFIQLSEPTIIFGLFRDQNASGPCYQLLFFYHHRIRLAVFSEAATTADEFSPGVFGSVVFHGFPLPPFILAAMVIQPETETTLAYQENTSFIEFLLKTGQIKRRRDGVQSPGQSVMPSILLPSPRP